MLAARYSACDQHKEKARDSLMRWVCLLVGMLLALVGCQSTDNAALVGGAASSPVVFRLGGTSYTVADYARRLDSEVGAQIAQLLADGQTRAAIEELASQNNLRRAIFDRMVQDALLGQVARRSGIGVDPAAVDAAVFAQTPTFDPTNPFSDLRVLRASQAQSQLTFTIVAQHTRADMLHVRQILVADERAADQILADLAGGADFATLARERSQEAESAEVGGDLGWRPRGDLPPELEAAAYAAPLATPAKVMSQLGWHLFAVIARQAGDTDDQKRPFDSFAQLQAAKNAQQFYQESFVPWYERLLAEAQASGDLALTPGFDPNSVPLPFPIAP